MAIDAAARAKINLALHVTGRRADGYHLLDSIVAFADVGDLITVKAADTLSLRLTGPFAAGLSPTDNLVLRAARALHPTRGAAITLEKTLPIASGLGGGSADAAATLQALSQLWSQPLPAPADVLALGADVPVCLLGHSARLQGIGEVLTPLPLPPVWAVLANPGVALATADVFHALQHRSNPPLTPPSALHSAASLASYLHAQRNDLAAAACTLAPVLSATLAALTAQPDCLIARMSGSGATCFGLFANQSQAEAAAQTLRPRNPGWWITATNLT